jgi:hypothetical protein
VEYFNAVEKTNLIYNALKGQHILARRNAAGYDFSNIHRLERATYSSPPQRGGNRFSNIHRPEMATYSSPPQRGGFGY